MTQTSDPAALRRLVYHLMIVVAVAAVCGRILGVQRVYEPTIHRTDPAKVAASITLAFGAGSEVEFLVLLQVGEKTWGRVDPGEPARVWPQTRPVPMPTFGSNDRSRWATIRAIVDQGTYVVGKRDPALKTSKNLYGDTGIVFEDGWQTVDMVLDPQLHPGNVQHFYSSKPPLLPTVVSGLYWLLKHLFGWSLADRPWYVVRAVLLLVNALPLLVYLLLLARLVERHGTTDWGRLYVLAAGAFGTLLTTFAISLNNHSIATCSALFALYPALLAWEGSSPATGEAGPRWRENLWYVLAGFFASLAACVELPATSFLVALFAILLLRSPTRALLFFLPGAALPLAGFFVTNYLALGRFTPAYGEFGGLWYEFPGSHWLANPARRRGIDWAFTMEGRAAYVFHFLLGHHGLFALTPIWILTVAGVILGLRRFGKRTRAEAVKPIGAILRAPATIVSPLTLMAGLTLVLSVVVIGFYLTMLPRWNYGGWTSGPRWLMWLTPFWLLTLLPVADWLAERRWGRRLGYLLLALSVLSVSYPAWNPWRHPWIYDFMEAQRWIQYG